MRCTVSNTLACPEPHTALPSSAVKVTSATMLAPSSAFPIAAATAIKNKYILYNQVVQSAKCIINQRGGAGRASAE